MGNRSSQSGSAKEPPATYGPLLESGDQLNVSARVLGSGAYGTVYECTRESVEPSRQGERLAVKMIDMKKGRNALSRGPDVKMLNSIQAEINILQKAQHHNCLGIKDIYRDDRWAALVMEYVDGGELFKVVDGKKNYDKNGERAAFNEYESLHVFRQILDALEYLHAENIIHRDLKLENVLVSSTAAAPWPQGQLFEIKLCDYGLGKELKDQMSKTATKCGTPQYQAPEMLQNQSYDAGIDLWCAGVLLYVMLHYRYPFEEHDKARDKFTCNRALSPDLQDFIGGLLKPDPAQRFTIATCRVHPWMLQDAIQMTAKQAEGHADVVLRSQASQNGIIVAKVPNGQTLTILADTVAECNQSGDDYIRLRWQDKEGYGKRKNMVVPETAGGYKDVTSPPKTGPLGEQPSQHALLAKQAEGYPEVVLRDAPSPAGNIIAMIPNLQPLTHLSDDGNYFKVRWNDKGQEGYIKKENLYHAIDMELEGAK